MKTSAKSRILHALRSGPQTTASLCQPDVGGVRFSARILELRRDGHNILATPLRAGSHLYKLDAGPSPCVEMASHRESGDVEAVPSVPSGGAALFDLSTPQPSLHDFEDAA